MNKNILVAVRGWLMLVVLVGSTAADGLGDWFQGTSPETISVSAVEPRLESQDFETTVTIEESEAFIVR